MDNTTESLKAAREYNPQQVQVIEHLYAQDDAGKRRALKRVLADAADELVRIDHRIETQRVALLRGSPCWLATMIQMLPPAISPTASLVDKKVYSTQLQTALEVVTTMQCP